MSAGQEQIRQVIAEQAGAWFVANQEGSLDNAGRAAFVAWLKSSPMHIEEYLGVALLARDLPAAAEDPEFSIESLVAEACSANDDKVAYLERPAYMPQLSTWRWQPIAAMAAAIVLVVTAVIWGSQSWWQNTAVAYETARGEQGTWQLADGSEIRLNTDSAVSVRYSNTERLVELTRGEAHFQVVHDSSRRFRVTAGTVETIAIGTRFDVYRQGTAVLITVTEGRVSVVAGQRQQRVDANYQLCVGAGGIRGEAVPVDTEQALAWLHHRIAFELRPLGDVADEFNRYGSLPLEIPDPELRALRISGVFDAGDLDSFVAFMETLDGVRVERTPTAIRVHRTAAGE